MGQIEEIVKAHEIGQKIFEELFAKSDEEIRETLRDMPGIGRDAGGMEGIYNQGLLQQGITRVIHDGKPESLKLYFYDNLFINATGITFYPEHGAPEVLIRFTKNFKL